MTHRHKQQRRGFRSNREYDIGNLWWTCKCGKRAYPDRRTARYALRNSTLDTTRMAPYAAPCQAGTFHVGHTNSATRDRYRGQAA